MDQHQDSVVVTGVDIPFWDLVKLQVKFAIASIPALFILLLFVMIAVGLLRSMF